MAAFHYQALNPQGKQQKGVIEALHAKHARQLLRAKNLTPIAVTLTAQKKIFSRKKSIHSKELALITRQLATLLSAGLPIEEVLGTVAEQTEKPQSKSLLLSVRSKVLEGHSFASALKEFPHAFSDLFCATVAAGEKSGHLDIVLQRLADYTEQQYLTRQKIMHALIYPAIMILVSIGIVGFLLEYVVPKMITVYSNIGQSLPILTQFLIGLSQGIQSVGIYILIFIALLIFLFLRGMKTSLNFRKNVHRYYLKIPVIGNTMQTANTARFSRTFAILSSAGVSVLDAMRIAASLITLIPIREAVFLATERVREGANIHLALKQTTYFSPMSIHLIASGEASGQLENMLERASAQQETDISRLIETSLTLLEPAIILVMGAIVLFIVLAVLLPIFQLDQLSG